MSAENEALIRRVFDEIAGEGRLDLAYEIYSPRYVDHQPFPGAPGNGPEGAYQSIGLMRTVCPDLRVVTHAVIAFDDVVACHNTWMGTHLGKVLNIEPTGRPVSFNALVVFRIEKGLIAERWSIGFDQNMRKALGLNFTWSPRSARTA